MQNKPLDLDALKVRWTAEQLADTSGKLSDLAQAQKAALSEYFDCSIKSVSFSPNWHYIELVLSNSLDRTALTRLLSGKVCYEGRMYRLDHLSPDTYSESDEVWGEWVESHHGSISIRLHSLDYQIRFR